MIVMSIAGVDPSGGAGVFTDIKTFQAIGVYGTGVVTALTCQNPYQIFSLKAIDSDYIKEQIDSVLSGYPEIEYMKTGMLYSKEIIKAVSQKIKEYKLKAVVDPVMVATSGGRLSEDEVANGLNKYLLPKAILTTPNISEASKLANIKITNEEDAIKASEIIGKTCNNVITGGHLNGINTLFIDDNITIKKQELIKTNNLHGSGCNFSAAIVAYLAKENNLKIAINKAFSYVFEAIKNGNHGTLNPNIK